MLFFSGARDALCDLNLLGGVLERLSVRRELETITNGDHSFRVPKRNGISEDDIYKQIVEKTLTWMDGSIPESIL